MKLYWGEPKNPGELKFHTGTLLSKDQDGVRMGRKQFSRMEVTGLYGLSFGMRFVGVMTFVGRGLENGKSEPWPFSRIGGTE